MLALYKGRSWVSRLIRWFNWSNYSHAAWVCRDGTIIEAWPPGGVQRAVSLFTNHLVDTAVDLYAVPGLTDAQRTRVEEFLVAQLGEPYDFMGVLGFLPRSRMENHAAWFCSELVFAGLQSAGLDLLRNIPACKVYPGLLALSPLLKQVDTVKVSRKTS